MAPRHALTEDTNMSFRNLPAPTRQMRHLTLPIPLSHHRLRFVLIAHTWSCVAADTVKRLGEADALEPISWNVAMLGRKSGMV